MADAEQYREWAAQQIDRRTRDAMYEEADRIERRESRRPIRVEVRVATSSSDVTP